MPTPHQDCRAPSTGRRYTISAGGKDKAAAGRRRDTGVQSSPAPFACPSYLIY